MSRADLLLPLGSGFQGSSTCADCCYEAPPILGPAHTRRHAPPTGLGQPGTLQASLLYREPRPSPAPPPATQAVHLGRLRVLEPAAPELTCPGLEAQVR